MCAAAIWCWIIQLALSRLKSLAKMKQHTHTRARTYTSFSSRTTCIFQISGNTADVSRDAGGGGMLISDVTQVGAVHISPIKCSPLCPATSSPLRTNFRTAHLRPQVGTPTPCGHHPAVRRLASVPALCSPALPCAFVFQFLLTKYLAFVLHPCAVFQAFLLTVRFRNNSASQGGGLEVTGASTAHLLRTSFVGNAAPLSAFFDYSGHGGAPLCTRPRSA